MSPLQYIIIMPGRCNCNTSWRHTLVTCNVHIHHLVLARHMREVEAASSTRWRVLSEELIVDGGEGNKVKSYWHSKFKIEEKTDQSSSIWSVSLFYFDEFNFVPRQRALERRRRAHGDHFHWGLEREVSRTSFQLPLTGFVEYSLLFLWKALFSWTCLVCIIHGLPYDRDTIKAQVLDVILSCTFSQPGIWFWHCLILICSNFEVHRLYRSVCARKGTTDWFLS